MLTWTSRRAGLVLWLLSSSLSIASALVPRNVSIDDTDSSITYTPSNTWREGNGCGSTCVLRPDPSQAHNGTWHDSTTSQNGVPHTIEVSFSGESNDKLVSPLVLISLSPCSLRDCRLRIFYRRGHRRQRRNFRQYNFCYRREKCQRLCAQPFKGSRFRIQCQRLYSERPVERTAHSTNDKRKHQCN